VPRSLTYALAVGALVCAAALLRAGPEPAAGKGDAPKPLPGFYLTAASSSDLEKQAHAAGVRFANEQASGHGLLALDFGAARFKSGTYGTALRGGTFFSNDDIRDAIEEAAKGYADHHKSGTSVEIVYANSNALLGDPGPGYEKFDESTASEAGKEQAEAVHDLDLDSDVTASVGGDIEPGYDKSAPVSVATTMVESAADEASGTYYDFGTAPCDPEGRCVNGWTVSDLCKVTTGSGRAALPEIYFDKLIDQPRQWYDVARKCDIKTFAGVSASPLGRLSPVQSYATLRRDTRAEVDPIIVVFPG
jgi:hypothetical protein